jgi:hypothetical protein
MKPFPSATHLTPVSKNGHPRWLIGVPSAQRIPLIPFHEGDAVRVTRLLASTRTFDGSRGLVREPRVGDVGAIVHVLGGGIFIVESVDATGLTLWVADFAAEELALVSAHPSSL